MPCKGVSALPPPGLATFLSLWSEEPNMTCGACHVILNKSGWGAGMAHEQEVRATST